MPKEKPARKIGFWTSTALVVGNMIGSGIFLLPASLAAYGSISLFGWLGSSFGAIALALMFSRLSKLIPGVSGGPYAYSRAGLGDFAAYLVAWGYWVSIWATNAAIAVTFVSYLTVFVPMLSSNAYVAMAVGLASIWFLTWINTRGIRAAGAVQLITTILKLAPLVWVAVIGFFYVDFSEFAPFNISGESGFSAISSTATLTLFAFLGLECATIPSENIRDPEKTIPRATMLGTAITILVYILGSVTVMGLVSNSALQQSNAPFADAAASVWGENARSWVAMGAIVSTFGALNGWILIQGQIPLAASRDNLFPRIFRLENERGIPAAGIVISSVLISALMISNFTKGLNEMFKFMILLSTVAVLVPYLFSAAAYALLSMRQKPVPRNMAGKISLAFTAFLYSLWAVVGSGQEAVYWGFIALLAGIPFYVWMKRKP